MAVARPLGNDYGKFLNCLALENDQDFYDNRAEKVVLMTMHASKGLEFPVVFVAGCEEGFIPYAPAKPFGWTIIAGPPFPWPTSPSYV